MATTPLSSSTIGSELARALLQVVRAFDHGDINIMFAAADRELTRTTDPDDNAGELLALLAEFYDVDLEE